MLHFNAPNCLLSTDNFFLFFFIAKGNFSFQIVKQKKNASTAVAHYTVWEEYGRSLCI